MKKIIKICYHCLLIIIILIISLNISDNWLDTTFNEEKDFWIHPNDVSSETDYIPLINNTSIQYRTSEESVVCLSRKNPYDIFYFYKLEHNYKTVSYNNNCLVMTNGIYTIEITLLSMDLDYTVYLIDVQKCND